MSVQFGQWTSNPLPPLASFFEKLSALLGPYGPDQCHSYEQDGVVLVYRALHTTKESRREIQPYIAQSGAVIMWDGRLDNRSDFLEQFSPALPVHSTDVAIVAAAYDRWGTDCFGRLIGDWAVSIWDPREHEVILAKDFIGTRHLYYSTASDCICWSTILDPLLVLAEKAFALDQEYVAGWFSFTPTLISRPMREFMRSRPPVTSD